MDAVLYILARCALILLRTLPVRCVARLGRAGGELFYWIDVRHRRVALKNLKRCFGVEKPPAELRATARENFRRIGENFATAAKTATMSDAELQPFFEVVGTEKIRRPPPDRKPQSCIVAIGHFGNFELFARGARWVPALQPATTYRGLRQPSLNRLLQSLRERSGCLFFERRTEAGALRTALNQTGLLLGLLADQHAGDRGLRIHFLGHECSTSAAPALFALRYQCALHTAICYRIGLARWRVEVGDEIPTHELDKPRSIEAITRDMNRAFETAVLRDPANWFWVHNRWKLPKQGTARPGRKPRVAHHVP
ncbi:MAG: hypothetical protein HY735_02110 [Verrucomicrobia bacterium]|nr:hypothetical protein [Verrucomicrobiota bacterium]